MQEPTTSDTTASEDPQQNAFSRVTIALLKGIVYLEGDPALWQQLLTLQGRVRDYMAQIGLELIIDEAEGYSWLRTRPTDPDESELPRLISRRQLPFTLSLLLALLRKRLAEFDASGAEQRLILSRDEIVELLQIFLPESSNETKTIKQIDTQINKVIEMGFLRRLKTAGQRKGQEEMLEVRRILKAFVDAQWLRDFDQQLEGDQTHLQQEAAANG